MKIPFIANYVEEYDFIENNVLIYDNVEQISFINKEKGNKAISYGPDTTILTETVENGDHDEYWFGPDTTTLTFTAENADQDEFYLVPETTRITRSLENSDSDEYYI